MKKSTSFGFALISQKASQEEIDNYRQSLLQEFPECVVLLPVQSNRKHGLVGRCFPLIAQARVEELDYLAVNVGIRRYFVPELIDLAKKSATHHPRAHLVIGEPIIDIEKNADFHQLIKNPQIRQRLLVDSFINHIISGALNIRYTNINAGIFCIRTTQEVVKALLNVNWYEDGSLVCPQIVWHLSRQGYEVKTLKVKNICLSELEFDLQSALIDIHYLFKMMAATDGGGTLPVGETVAKFLTECAFVRKWKINKDDEWFWNAIFEPLKMMHGEK